MINGAYHTKPMSDPRPLPDLLAEPIKNFGNARSDDIVRTLGMLNLALMNDRPIDCIVSPERAVEELSRYSFGMRMGRNGRFTLFRSQANAAVAAITHVTHVGKDYLELDALARHPDTRGQRMGTAALRYVIAQGNRDGIRAIGLWTPVKNIKFYEQNGFRIDDEVSKSSGNKTFFRMEQHIS